MSPILQFPLADVTALAEHAVAADRFNPDYGAPAYPALLVIVERGIHLRSNARPALPPAADQQQPFGYYVRVVYAAGYGPHAPLGPWMHAANCFRDGIFTEVPLSPPGGHAVVARFRALLRQGFDTLVIDPRTNPMSVTVTRSGSRPA